MNLILVKDMPDSSDSESDSENDQRNTIAQLSFQVTTSPPFPKKTKKNIQQKWVIAYPLTKPGVDRIPYGVIAWWQSVFEYLEHSDYERIHLRRLCHLFKDALQPAPSGLYTVYPHPNYSSLDSLINFCNALYEEDPSRAPRVLFIKEGDHEIDGYEKECSLLDPIQFQEDGLEIKKFHEHFASVKYPIKIVGAGQNKTFIHGGGFSIDAKKSSGGEQIELSQMTIHYTADCAIYGNDGLSFIGDKLTLSHCGTSGVMAMGTEGRLLNCVVTQCGLSGICSGYNALIEVAGEKTKVDGNGTLGESDSYGLHTYDTSSFIHLLAPLTKESVSFNNYNGQNYGSSRQATSGGTIQTVGVLENLFAVVAEDEDVLATLCDGYYASKDDDDDDDEAYASQDV